MTVESKLIARVETVGAEKASDSLRKFTQQATATENTVKSMGKALAGAFTAAAISKTISGMIDIAHRYDDIADAAERMGLSVREFQALQFAGNDIGMSAEQMSKSFLNAEKAMVKLQTTGKGGLANALKALGDQTKLTKNDFANLSGEEGAQKLVSEMERLGVSHRDQIVLLDGVSKGLSKMLPLLQDNGAAMKQLKNASEDLNQSLGLTGSQADALSRLDQSANTLATAWDQAKTKVVSVFANILSSNAEFATGIIKNTGEMIDAWGIYLDLLDGTASSYNALLIQSDEQTGAVLEAQKAVNDSQDYYNQLVSNGHDILAAYYKTLLDDDKKALATAQGKLSATQKQILAHKDESNEIENKTVATLTNAEAEKTSDMEKLARLKLLDRARAMEFDVNINRMKIYQELNTESEKKSALEYYIQLEEREKAASEYYNKVKEFTDAEVANKSISLEKQNALLLEAENVKDSYVKKFEDNKITRTQMINRELEILDIERREFVAKSLGMEDVAFANSQEIKLREYENSLDAAVLELSMSLDERERLLEEFNSKQTGEQAYYDENQKYSMERRSAEFNAIANDTLESRIRLIETSYNDEYNFINDMQLKGEISAQEHADKLAQIQIESDARVAEERVKSMAKYLDGTASMADATANIFEISYAKRRAARDAADKDDTSGMVRQWRIAKSFALASATLSAYAAGAQAFASPTALTPEGKFAAYAVTIAGALNVVGQAMQMDWTPPRAQGGMVNRNQPYLVGEKGPELFTPGMSGRITDTNRTMGMGNGITQNVNIINNSPAKVTSQTDDNGDLIIMVQEVMGQEVMNPNSRFNKNFNKTRKTERKF